MRLYLLSLIVMLLSIVVGVKSQTTIHGTVFDNTNQPVPYANVLILTQGDSSLVKGALTDFDGEFNVTFSSNQLVIASIQYMGFNDVNTAINPNQSIINLGSINLETSTTSLDEVVVKYKRPLYEQEIDRTIVNVQSSVTNAGNTALNVLAKSPSVTVNRATGQINLQGKSGVLVMINDKEVRMDAADLINLLDGMPAANIENIELITTPPASYDAQGVGGIINLNLIESNTDGFMGRASVNAGYAKKPKYGGSLNLNLRRGKFYSYANLSANINHRLPEISLYTDYKYPNNRVISDMESSRETRGALYNADFGLSYDLTSKTTVGGMVNFYNRDWSMVATSLTETMSERDGLSTQYIESDEVNNLVRTLYNAYANHSFSEAFKLSLDYDFINFYRNNPANYRALNNEGMAGENESRSKSSAETPLDIHVLKADFEVIATDNVKFELGGKYSLSGFENKVRVAEYQEGNYFDNPEFTRIYNMDEEVYAAYASMDWQIAPKLLMKGGLRYEKYALQLNAADENILDDTDGRFFPSLFFNYSLNDNNTIIASYAQRIGRPGFLQLAPYFYFMNNNTLFTGNPYLVPSSSTQYRISYAHRKFTVSAEYTKTDKPIFNIQPHYDAEKELALFGFRQGLEANVYSLSLSVPWEISNKWTSTYSLINYYRNETTMVLDDPYNIKSYGANININQSYEVTDKLIIEANFMYNTPYYEGAAHIQLRTGLDLGLQYKFKNSATLAFNVEDVYDMSSGWPINAHVPEYGMEYQWEWSYPAPVFRINFSIPLGNHNFKTKVKHTSGSAEELKRL